MKPYLYENYKGDGAFVYLCTAGDDDAPIYLAERMAEMHVNLVLDVVGISDPREMAEKIAAASACLFFFSSEAVTSVAFRNRVNHAIAAGKKLISLRSSFVELAHGMEMQLANYPMLVYSGPEWTIGQLKKEGYLPPEVIGDAPKKVKKKITGYIVAAVLLLLAAFLVPKFLSWYQGRKVIATYEGQTLEKLDLSDAGLATLSGIEKVMVKDLDISGNTELTDFSPLLTENGPETVRISQDMLEYAQTLKDKVRLVITR